jgi:hypothetical protein
MKRCGRCKEWKDVGSFAVRRHRGDGLQPYCRGCQHVVYTSYYAKHRHAFRAMLAERAGRQRLINRTFVAEYLRDHPCVDCGLADPIVLEFDHVRDTKIADIASMVYAPVALRTLQREIKKCDVRCANCHRRRTARSWRYTLRRPERQERDEAVTERRWLLAW